MTAVGVEPGSWIAFTGMIALGAVGPPHFGPPIVPFSNPIQPMPDPIGRVRSVGNFSQPELDGGSEVAASPEWRRVPLNLSQNRAGSAGLVRVCRGPAFPDGGLFC
jgi:hypothetical protein